jgi:NADH-quinone oxidoreductase subunit M
MNDLHAPWLTGLILVPVLGAVAVLWRRPWAHPLGVVSTLLSMPLAVAAWIDLGLRHSAADRWIAALRIDDMSAPLLVCSAIMLAAIVVTTPRARRNPIGASKFLLSEAILFATFATSDPWMLAVLFSAGCILPWTEVRSRAFAIYMAAASILFVSGLVLGVERWGWLPLMGAIFIRKGIMPLHSWLPSFFEKARPGTAAIFAVPQVGTYCAARLILPSAPSSALEAMGIAALVTAVYAAWLGLVQKDARRMFGYFFMSQSAIVLAGLQCDNLNGLAGGLTLWVASILSLSGFGLTLRALEARRGALSLAKFHGGYDRMPLLAASFLLMGFASIGVPGTLGFVAEELLLDGAVETFPTFGVLVAVAVALNGITVLRAYGSLFCGTRSNPYQEGMRPRERAAVLVLVLCLLAVGLWPQPLVRTEAWAAASLLEQRRK